MDALWTLMFILGWIVAGIPAYIIIRSITKRQKERWLVKDSIFFIVCCSICGPVGSILGSIAVILIALDEKGYSLDKWLNKPSKW